MRSTSFRIPGRIGKKMKHTPSMITTLPKPTTTTTAMPLKAQAWRGSVGKFYENFIKKFDNFRNKEIFLFLEKVPKINFKKLNKIFFV